MNRHRHWNALAIRIGLLAVLVATISLAGGVVTAFAADLADAAGATPAVHNLLVNASAVLIVLAGVALHAKSVRTWQPAPAFMPDEAEDDDSIALLREHLQAARRALSTAYDQRDALAEKYPGRG